MIYFILLTIMVVSGVFLVYMIYSSYICYKKLLDWKDISIKKVGYADYIISFTDGYGIKRSYRGSCTIWYDAETAASINTEARIKLHQIWQKEEWKSKENS